MLVDCSWSPTHSRPWCFKIFLQCFVFWWSFMSTSTQTSCYVMVILGWGWVGQWRSCQLAHTRHATLLLCSLAPCTHTSCYVMVILGWGGVGQWRSCQLAHTRHATLWLCWGGVGWGGVGQWRSCQLAHTRHAHRLYSQKLSKTVVSWSQHKRTPWIGKVCLGLLLSKIFGTIDTSPISRRTLQGRQSNEWSASEKKEKGAASKKNTNLCQKTK